MFRGLLRPGQGFQKFTILRREGDISSKGRPYTGALSRCGGFDGIISSSSPSEIERFKQLGHTVTDKIIQQGTTCRAKANDILELREGKQTRRFLVHGDPRNPGELGHFLIYHVEERTDLK